MAKQQSSVLLLLIGISIMLSFHSSIVNLNGKDGQSPDPDVLKAEIIEGVLRELNRTQLLSRANQQELRVAPSSATSPMSCSELMSRPGSKYLEGSFITRHTTPHKWTPRIDGSREFDLTSICSLKRYNADEARKCFAGQHVNFIGDSVTRYQVFSLAYFLEKGQYPPRFPSSKVLHDECRFHVDEHGQSQCSPEGLPNICTEVDWWHHYTTRSWDMLYQALGGSTDGGIFNGRLECNCARSDEDKLHTENLLYVTKPDDDGNRITLSVFHERGWDHEIQPIRGHFFSGCAYNGTCRLDETKMASLFSSMRSDNYDYSQELADAINPDGGILRQIVPNVDVSIYNRGLWGRLDPDRAKKIFPLLSNWTGSGQGRCFYKSTTGSGHHESLALHQHEIQSDIRAEAASAGCSFLDFGHITKDFASIYYHTGNGAVPKDLNLERTDVYWDMVHFVPWVYEELNNVLLNVLCNANQQV